MLFKARKMKISVRSLALYLLLDSVFGMFQLLCLCVSSAAKIQSENKNNTTVTDKNTISLSLSDETEVRV